MSIFFLSHHIPAVWPDRFTKILVRLDFLEGWFSMDTSADIPGVLALEILNSMNEFTASIGLSLTQVFRNSEHIRCDSLVVLNRFLHNNSLWISFVHSLVMDSIGGSVRHSFLAITKGVLLRIKLPIIVTNFLLTWSEIAVSVSVHRRNGWII